MSPIPKPPRRDKTPVEKALDRMLEQARQGQMPMPTGAIIHPNDLQALLGTMTLEQQLEASLWSVARMHAPIYTQEALYTHVGPGHMEDDWYVKRLNGTEEVFLLCKCQTILVLSRCAYFFNGKEGDADGNKPRQGDRCEEPAFPKEATYRRDIRCGFHKVRVMR